MFENSINNMPIGVFDSGIGGISILKKLKKYFPNENFIYYGDSLNFPYGIKKEDDLIKICIEIGDYFISKNVKAIVIACNTATLTVLEIFRKKYNIPIIGIKPLSNKVINIKDCNNILIFATSLSLKKIKADVNTNKNVFLIPALELVNFVENGIFKGNLIDSTIKKYLKNINIKKVNILILGCTHFIFLENSFRKILGDDCLILDSSMDIINNLKNVLVEKDIYNKNQNAGNITIINSIDDYDKIEFSYNLLN